MLLVSALGMEKVLLNSLKPGLSTPSDLGALMIPPEVMLLS